MVDMTFTKHDEIIPLESTHYPAWLGVDMVRNPDGLPMLKTRRGWEAYAKRIAAKGSKRDRFAWHPVVAFIPWRDAYRVSLGGQHDVIWSGFTCHVKKEDARD